MASFTQSGPSSAVASISDLDGYTLRDYNSYFPADQDEFGFDPPEQKTFYGKTNQTYSPHEQTPESLLGDWPGFEREEDRKQKPSLEHMHQLDKLITQNLPNSVNAVSRYGQVTPPRTNSADSVGVDRHDENTSPQNTTKRKTKQGKESTQPASATPGRKRKNSRKVAANASIEDFSDAPENSKRKASLEKNRLAAAKCRVNKKEKTEQLQRDSHDKAVHNAYLKDQIMRMKEEVQQLNALLLAHSSCEGCKSPEEIQKQLQELSAEYLPRQINMSGFPDYAEMPLDGMPSVNEEEDGYFSLRNHAQPILNPPLPDFDRSANFEVHTPMQTD